MCTAACPVPDVGVFIWSPRAFKERQEVQGRQKEAHQNYLKSKVTARRRRATTRLQTPTHTILPPAYMQALIEAGDFVGAEEALQNAIASWPDSSRFHLAMAVCISKHRKDPERALSWSGTDRLFVVHKPAFTPLLVAPLSGLTRPLPCMTV